MPLAIVGEERPIIPSTIAAQACVRRETLPVERICSSVLKCVRWGFRPNIAPEEDTLVFAPESGVRERRCSSHAIPPTAPIVPSPTNPARTVRRDILGGHRVSKKEIGLAEACCGGRVMASLGSCTGGVCTGRAVGVVNCVDGNGVSG